MRSTFVKLLAGGLVASLLLVGSAAAQVEPLDPPERVNVAYVPIMKFATMYVAAERGLFEKYGLDVEINRVASGTEAIAFLTEGQIDVGGIAIVTSLWNGWNQGLDIRVIAPGGLEPFEDSPTRLMVRTDLAESGAVTDVADLQGRNVAVAGGPGSGGEYLAAKALERGDLTIREVTKPVTFSFDFGGFGVDPWGNYKAGATAKTVINREEFGLTWNAALETGGVLVGKDVTIELDLQGALQQD